MESWPGSDDEAHCGVNRATKNSTPERHELAGQIHAHLDGENLGFRPNHWQLACAPSMENWPGSSDDEAGGYGSRQHDGEY